MARTPDEKARKQKNSFILEKARQVFCRKGYLTVTMQDIVDECGISRGGIYLYYPSVEEIFKAVIASRNRSRFEEVRTLAEADTSFWQLLDTYLALQKQRLLHMEGSILRATYEYYHSHQSEEDIAFRLAQVGAVRNTITAILEVGVRQKAIRGDNLAQITETIMYLIEGMGVFGMYHNLTPQSLEAQLDLLRGLVGSEALP